MIIVEGSESLHHTGQSNDDISLGAAKPRPRCVVDARSSTYTHISLCVGGGARGFGRTRHLLRVKRQNKSSQLLFLQ